MRKLYALLFLAAIVGMIAIGCQNDPNPAGFQNQAIDPGLVSSQLETVPASAITEAYFHVYVYEANSRTVNIHRITNSWDEYLVTWNNFGGAYAPGIENTFDANAVGWYKVDLTSLVKDWVSGTYPNYGILLEHGYLQDPFTIMSSRENYKCNPFLEVCYEMGGVIVCDTIMALGDSYIWQFSPDLNRGLSEIIYAGWTTDQYEKQGLFKFDLPVVPELGAIGDYVWEDVDRDGIQDAGEPGIPGVVIHLMDCDYNIIATDVTDANGLYLFTDLPAGNYMVHFELPPGWTFTVLNAGMDPSLDSDAHPGNGLVDCFNLGSGEVNLTIDAGMFMEPYGECEGKVTQLTLRYDGDIDDAHVVITMKRFGDVFDGIVQPGELFTFVGADRKGTLGPEINVYVNDRFNTEIHTSCSQLIGPGLVKGDFTVIEGYSRKGGLLPPL